MLSTNYSLVNYYSFNITIPNKNNSLIYGSMYTYPIQIIF